LEYCSWAQDIIFKHLTGKLDKGAEMSSYETELLVEPLLRLEYRYWAPDPKHVYEPNEGVVFVNPPANTQDYDYAYHEAKRLFAQMFGQDEYFLIPTEDDNVEIEEEYLN
jgi:hypothetical protein